jgi:hypothetical protein
MDIYCTVKTRMPRQPALRVALQAPQQTRGIRSRGRRNHSNNKACRAGEGGGDIILMKGCGLNSLKRGEGWRLLLAHLIYTWMLVFDGSSIFTYLPPTSSSSYIRASRFSCASFRFARIIQSICSFC